MRTLILVFISCLPVTTLAAESISAGLTLNSSPGSTSSTSRIEYSGYLVSGYLTQINTGVSHERSQTPYSTVSNELGDVINLGDSESRWVVSGGITQDVHPNLAVRLDGRALASESRFGSEGFTAALDSNFFNRQFFLSPSISVYQIRQPEGFFVNAFQETTEIQQQIQQIDYDLAATLLVTGNFQYRILTGYRTREDRPDALKARVDAAYAFPATGIVLRAGLGGLYESDSLPRNAQYGVIRGMESLLGLTWNITPIHAISGFYAGHLEREAPLVNEESRFGADTLSLGYSLTSDKVTLSSSLNYAMANDGKDYFGFLADVSLNL
jgi:hypothetical protein